jgi:hypothetical protein
MRSMVKRVLPGTAAEAEGPLHRFAVPLTQWVRILGDIPLIRRSSAAKTPPPSWA